MDVFNAQIALSSFMMAIGVAAITQILLAKKTEMKKVVATLKALASAAFIGYGASSIANMVTQDVAGCPLAILLANITYHAGFVLCETIWLYQAYIFLNHAIWMKRLAPVIMVARAGTGLWDSIASYGKLDPQSLVCVFYQDSAAGTVYSSFDIAIDVLVTLLNIYSMLRFGQTEQSIAFRSGNLFRSLIITGYSTFLIVALYAAPELLATPIYYVVQSVLTIVLTLYDREIFRLFSYLARKLNLGKDTQVLKSQGAISSQRLKANATVSEQ